MSATIPTFNLPAQVSYWAGKHVEVIGYYQAEEAELQPNGSILERVDRSGRSNVDRDLRHGRDNLRFRSHHPEGLAINADQTRHRHGSLRPMAGYIIGKPVCCRPDAEVRIVCNKGNRGRAKAIGLEGILILGKYISGLVQPSQQDKKEGQLSHGSRSEESLVGYLLMLVPAREGCHQRPLGSNDLKPPSRKPVPETGGSA
jgi:hypothetical protein